MDLIVIVCERKKMRIKKYQILLIMLLNLMGRYCCYASVDSLIDPMDKITRVICIGLANQNQKTEQVRSFVRTCGESALVDDGKYERGYTFPDSAFFASFLERMGEHLSAGIPENVLDLGCGNGSTTMLIALMGAKAFGIDLYLGWEDTGLIMRKFTECKELAQILHPERTFACALKGGIDATKLLETGPSFGLSRNYTSAYLGSFLHMFDPATAKKILKDLLHFLQPGGMVYASVDAVGIEPQVLKTYDAAKAMGKPFPSVISTNSMGTLEHRDGETIFIKTFPVNMYFSENVDAEGNAQFPCRVRSYNYILVNDPDVLQAAYPHRKFQKGERIGAHLNLGVVSVTECFYTMDMIRFVFADDWNLQILGRTVTGEFTQELNDRDTVHFYIVAQKK